MSAPRVDVLAVWQAARADVRLDRSSRVILAHIARVGLIGSPARLAQAVGLDAPTVSARLDLLRASGYVPEPKAAPRVNSAIRRPRGIREDAQDAA